MFLLLGINPNLQIHVGFLRVCAGSGGGGGGGGGGKIPQYEVFPMSGDWSKLFKLCHN